MTMRRLRRWLACFVQGHDYGRPYGLAYWLTEFVWTRSARCRRCGEVATFVVPTPLGSAAHTVTVRR